MLQQGQLPHTQRMNGRWDQPAVQFVDAAELLDIPKLLTDSAAVEKVSTRPSYWLGDG
jgi:hypothetical protein